MPKPQRPGVAGPFPRGWPKLCVAIRLRDGFTCRRCGYRVALGAPAVDHIIPRRLGGDNDPQNLGCLCAECHAWKSQVLEPALYRGDVLAFNRFLRQIGDPRPTPEMVAAGLQRLNKLLQEAHDGNR